MVKFSHIVTFDDGDKQTTGRLKGDSHHDEQVRAANTELLDKKQTNDKAVQQKIIEWANYLNQLKAIHIAYAACDSLSTWHSTLRYCCSLVTDTSSAKDALIFTALTSREGLICFCSGALVMMSIAVIANIADKDAKGIQKFCADYWPYIRDVLKAAKNSYKGVSNTLKIAQALGATGHLNQLATPLGLLVGSIHIINTIYYRRICNWRKQAMDDNNALRQEIYDAESLSQANTINYLKRIKRQSQSEKNEALTSAAFSGIVNGLYYQMGILTMSSFAPPLLIALTVMCTIIFITNVITKAYQEYHFQQKLERTALEIELTLAAKQAATSAHELYLLLKISQEVASNKTNKEKDEQLNKAIKEYKNSFKNYKELKKRHKKHLSPSIIEAIFKGINDSAYAYSAISSLFFSVSLVMMLCSTAMPPLAILGVVLAGFACMAIFITRSTYKAYQAQQVENKQESKHKQDLKEIEIKLNQATESINQHQQTWVHRQNIKASILGNLDKTLDDTPQPSFQELFEVIRSLFSGLNKGEKPFDAYYTPDVDKDDKVQAFLMWSTIAVSLTYALVYALRAFAKTLSRFHTEKKPAEDNDDIEQEQTDDDHDPNYEDFDKDDGNPPRLEEPQIEQPELSSKLSSSNHTPPSLKNSPDSFFSAKQRSKRPAMTKSKSFDNLYALKNQADSKLSHFKPQLPDTAEVIAPTTSEHSLQVA